jgi:hypothetical protein
MGRLSGTLDDWSIAEKLHADGRSADAVQILNGILGIESGIDAGAIDAILRRQLEGPDEKSRELSSMSTMPDGSIRVDVNMGHVRLGARFLPDLLVLRGRCLVDRMDKETFQTPQGPALPHDLVVDAVANSQLLSGYYANDATKLALASQPYLKINDWRNFASVLGHALHVEPANQLANAVFDYFQRVTEHHAAQSADSQLVAAMLSVLEYLKDVKAQARSR